jgi:AraC-like DNA-binding protein
MSPRSFARHFQAETGLSFGAWRRQAQLLRALELLGAGLSVGDVAFTLGYDSTSAFIAMFRRAFDTTPSRYFEASK